MPVYARTCVTAGTFHNFPNALMTELRNALNGGVLPARYYALGKQHAGDVRRLPPGHPWGTTLPILRRMAALAKVARPGENAFGNFSTFGKHTLAMVPSRTDCAPDW
jgi:hypothetical protein